MTVYIMCDLEGTAGVVSFEHQQWLQGRWYEQARRLATLELNAAVEGCLEAGATEIIAGDGGPLGLDSTFTAAMMVGLHGMAHAKGGSMAHSFMGGIEGFWLDGREFGEVSMNTWVAGAAAVPMIFLAGDGQVGLHRKGSAFAGAAESPGNDS